MSKKFYTNIENQEHCVEAIAFDKLKSATLGEATVERIGNDIYSVSANGARTTVVVVKRNEDSVRFGINGQLIDIHVESEGEQLIKKLGLILNRAKKIK